VSCKKHLVLFHKLWPKFFENRRNKFLKRYVNIHNLNWRDHLQHIWMVLHCLREIHLNLNPSKCCFGVQNSTFLGHVVSVEGSYPDPKKIVNVQNFPIPKTITNVRAFLGLIGYYCKFISKYAKIAGPLFGLTKKVCKFVWTPIYQGAFVTLKRCMVISQVLTRSNFSQSFVLDMDWSIRAVGTILSQKFEKHEQFIAYASKGLSPIQKHLHPMEGECYVFIWGIMHF